MRSRSRTLFLLLALVAGILPVAGSVAAASSAPHWVNDDDPNGGSYVPRGKGCHDPGYATIQAAVIAASPGDRINVCPGRYTEQVTIPAGKDHLQLRSTDHLAAVIKAPATMAEPRAIVHVNGARNVAIRDFTITGPGSGSCDSLRFGVRVDMNGSAVITRNRITEIRNELLCGHSSEFGVAIQVGQQAEGQVGIATITHNLIDSYREAGVVVDGPGSSAEIERNVIRGVGPTEIFPQHGVQISQGAQADVLRNQISDNVFAPQFDVSTGILLFSPGAVRVRDNEMTRTDEGVFAIFAVGPVIERNRLSDSTFDGIRLFATSNALVKQNRASGSGFDGIFVESSSFDNLLRDNRLFDNVEHDCHDDSVGAVPAVPANVWIRNDGETENVPGLCQSRRQHDHDDDTD